MLLLRQEICGTDLCIKAPALGTKAMLNALQTLSETYLKRLSDRNGILGASYPSLHFVFSPEPACHEVSNRLCHILPL